MYNVEIYTENKAQDCICGKFDKLNDDLRNFVKASAATLRQRNDAKVKCTAIVTDSFSQAKREFAC